MDPHVFLSILTALSDASQRALTPQSIAKKNVTHRVLPEDVDRVVTALTLIPAVVVLRSPSGKLKGLSLHVNRPGVCGELFMRHEYFTTCFYKDGVLMHKIRDGNYAQGNTIRAELRLEAQRLGLPYLVEGELHANLDALASAASAHINAQAIVPQTSTLNSRQSTPRQS